LRFIKKIEKHSHLISASLSNLPHSQYLLIINYINSKLNGIFLKAILM
jgi:hypothetical protein